MWTGNWREETWSRLDQAWDLIIIGGGISKKFDKFGGYLKSNAKIVPAKLFNDAGIVGAAMAASKLHV